MCGRKKETFCFFLPTCLPLICFFCLFALTRISSVVSRSRGERDTLAMFPLLVRGFWLPFTNLGVPCWGSRIPLVKLREFCPTACFERTIELPGLFAPLMQELISDLGAGRDKCAWDRSHRADVYNSSYLS